MILIGLATQWVVAAAAFVVAVGLTIVWMRTGRKAMLVGALAALVVGGATLLVESLIVTDEERVEAEIVELARDIEAGDIATVLDHLHPDALELRQDAQSYLPRFDFSRVMINMRRIEIHGEQNPRTATAEFLVVADGTEKSSSQPIPPNARPFFRVELVEQSGRWLLRSYELRNTMEAFQKPQSR